MGRNDTRMMNAELMTDDSKRRWRGKRGRECWGNLKLAFVRMQVMTPQEALQNGGESIPWTLAVPWGAGLPEHHRTHLMSPPAHELHGVLVLEVAGSSI
jgi:hypothetical protein